MPPQLRTALAALCCGSAAALAGLPTLDLYLDLRMTVRGPADALETIAAQPDGLILWESAAAPDWGDELEGLDVIAVDPGAKNVAGLPSVRRGRAARLFEPPFDTQEVVGACSPGGVLLVDSTADVWERETLPLIEIAAAAAADTAKVLVSLYDSTMLAQVSEKLVLGAMTGSALPTFGAADAGAGAGGLGVALPPDPGLWKHAQTYNIR